METDIFFLSYLESNREKNWFKLKEKYPKARRVHGIKGLPLAHQICAKLSQTEFFFVVNADNEICNNFHFKIPSKKLYQTYLKSSISERKKSASSKNRREVDFEIDREKNKKDKKRQIDKKGENQENLTHTYLKPAVYCWRSLNPVNGLIYGFGGVKLFPKSLFSSQPSSFVDLSTSFKGKYQVVEELASITKFNASALDAWRGAFRECVKLASECISNQKSKETEERLTIWCEKGIEKAFGKYVLMGAKQGRDYGLKNKDNRKALSKINDFEWLKARFQQKTAKNDFQN